VAGGQSILATYRQPKDSPLTPIDG
jgi:hypothetical protein